MKYFIEQPFEGYAVVDGVINVNPKKPEFGFIGIRRKGIMLGNFAKVDKSIAFISGEIATLREIVAEYKLEVGMDASEVLNVKVVVRESFEPFYPTQEPKINPVTKAIVTSGGKPVYRSSFIVDKDSTDKDIFLENDKVPVESTPIPENAQEFANSVINQLTNL